MSLGYVSEANFIPAACQNLGLGFLTHPYFLSLSVPFVFPPPQTVFLQPPIQYVPSGFSDCGGWGVGCWLHGNAVLGSSGHAITFL